MKLPTLFNPSNDMALAANVRQYSPPRRIQQMEADLADLARLWDEGPWGWSLATRQRYLRMGVPESELPSEEWLEEVRRLSSRAFAVEYYRRMDSLSFPCDEEGRNPLLPCQARFVTNVDELRSLPPFAPRCSASTSEGQATGEDGGGLIFKAPWSSSGRGNIVVRGEPDEATRRRIARIVQGEGGVVVEPFYTDKVLDFAMEFLLRDAPQAQGGSRAGEAEVDFLGYSVFDADETGHYRGNYVESQAELLQRIDLSPELLRALVDHHRRALSALPYRGPVGIDMMKLRNNRVHPCVEINFRMTMGLLALLLHRKGLVGDQLLTPNRTHGFVSSIRQGRLTITYNN